MSGANTNTNARGLSNFISDLRNCSSKDDEKARIQKELANIRKHFTTSSTLSSYQKKKYVWKLVYIFMLGYDVDFGHAEIVSLVASNKYSEKQVGYVAMSLLLRSGDDMMGMVINSVRTDLSPQSDDASQSLALTAIANVSGIELMKNLNKDVQQVLLRSNTTPAVKKKAALCLLRLVRQLPDSVESEEFSSCIAELLQDRHFGVLCSTMSLLIGLTSKQEIQYSTMIPYAIHILNNLVLKNHCTPDYLYYRTPSPWLQIKLLRFLQYYPDLCSSDEKYVPVLKECLTKILSDTDVSDSINKSNADHAILFEAINLIIVFGTSGSKTLQESAMKLLGKFISVREPNIRYLGLMTMSRLATLHDINKSHIKRHQSTVVVSLKDADISVRRRALDLLFVIADEDNSESIIDELLTYLVTADSAIREQMVLKIAVLAEKFATDLKWYVDTILRIISIAGDQVSDSIWHRVIVIVTNNREGDLQSYAASTIFDTVTSKKCHENAVKVGAYILGEFGFLIAEEPGKSGEMQFKVLNQHWNGVSSSTKALLLTSYAKLSNLYEEVRPLVDPIFEKLSVSVELELQQRANEYKMLRLTYEPDIVEDILREMPPFDTSKVSTLEMRINEEQEDNEDGNVFTKKKVVHEDEIRQRSSSSSYNDGESTERSGAKKQVEQPVVDLLGGFDDSDDDDQNNNTPPQPPTSSSSQPQGIPERSLPGLRSSFSKLCGSPSGILFENEFVQVGFKHEYKGSQGRIQLFVGNMTSIALSNIRVDIPNVSYLRTKINADPADLISEDGATCNAKSQVKIQMMVEVLAPYADAPEMRVTFTSNGSNYDYPLRLPIVTTCFVEPVVLEKDVFMQRWGGLSGEREAQEIVQLSSATNKEFVTKVAGLLTSSTITFGRCPTVDTPQTISLAGTFKTGAKDGNGNAISVGCLLRLECNGDKVRVTARTMQGVTSKGVKNVVVGVVKVLGA